MTVKELIEKLKDCDPLAEVRIPLSMLTYEIIGFVSEDETEPAVYLSGEVEILKK